MQMGSFELQQAALWISKTAQKCEVNSKEQE